LDAGITAWNKRDRIIDGVIDFQIPPKLDLVQSMSPKDQSNFKCIVYVDGHQASSRIIWQLCSGTALVVVDSQSLTLAPRIWIHDYLIENGIAKERLKFRGLSFQSPVVFPEFSDEDRAKNRRVEIEIL
jgi:hypothetical protein